MKYGEPRVQSEIFDESESRYSSLKKCYNADATKTENSTSDGADRKSLHEKSSISNLQKCLNVLLESNIDELSVQLEPICTQTLKKKKQCVKHLRH